MERKVIWGLGHAAFTVTDLEASLEFATRMLGLREMERRDGAVFLTDGKAEPSLEFRAGDVTALDHFALVTTGPATVEQVRLHLIEAGVEVFDSPEEPNIEQSVRFRAPSGHVIDVYCASANVPAWDPLGQPPHIASGVRPVAAQHITLVADDRGAFVDFMVDVLGFMVTDHVTGPDGSIAITFLRAGSRLHHTVGVGQGASGMHHYAFQLQSVYDIVRMGDLLHATGRGFRWGPSRHRLGDNIAAYFEEPSGIAVEYFSEMQLIIDDRWEPRVLSITDPTMASTWGPPALLPSSMTAIPIVPSSTRTPS
jgi:catechol 2,3-dioxygenase-like lactoylglutathione lyase family enzyme